MLQIKNKIDDYQILFYFALTNFPNTIKDDVDCTLCEREGREREGEREGEREIILSVSVTHYETPRVEIDVLLTIKILYMQ